MGFHIKVSDALFTYLLIGARSIACPNDLNSLGSPTISPEGIYFNNKKQGVRIENAVNVYLTTKFMFAVWVKTFYITPYRDEVILS